VARVAAMSTVKVYSLGGLDKKSNDLTRATEKASEMLNLEYDTQSMLKKRNGFEEVLIDAASIGSLGIGTIKDMIYFGLRDELIVFALSSGFIYVYALTRNGTTWNKRSISPHAFLYSTDAQFPVSYCENQNNLYFTFQDLQTPVIKYDGSLCTSSGLLVPFNTYDKKKIVVEGAAGVYSGTIDVNGYYLRTFLEYIDYNGNITYGPYLESVHTFPSGTAINIQNINLMGVMDRYMFIASGGFTLNSSNRTIQTGTGGHNYQGGEKFLLIADDLGYVTITSPANRVSLQLVIESVTSTSVTFTLASVGTNSVVFSVLPAGLNIDRRCKIKVAASKSQATGYYLLTDIVAGSAYAGVSDILSTYSNYLTPDHITINDTGFAAGTLIPFEDVYDSTTLKTCPPISKYITSFGDQIVYGNISSVINLDNQWITYDIADLIMYSDTSTGDGPENVSELNRQKIGDSRDGAITGLRRCNDSAIIFKNNGVYSIDGVMIQGQYALRKINTNFVGCTSEKSILQAEEGLYFQAHNGIYFTNGISVNKLSYEIDSLFLSGPYLSTKAARLKKKQKSFFYVPDILSGTSKFVVIDYYYNQIYMWNMDKNPTIGLIEDKNGDVYFTDGTKLYKFNDLYTDNGVAITSVYSTTWHHAGEPSLNKKWLSMRMFGLTDAAFTATITTQGDWDTTNLTTNSLVFNSTDQTKFVMFDMKTKRSFRVTFTNAVNAENMVITGYELTYEAFNVVDKN
jgi:hypothetical protein